MALIQSSPESFYLSLLEGLSGQVSSAGGLEEGEVSSGLDIPLLLQLGQGARSQEHLEGWDRERVNGWSE